jgi:hypothetical protein
MYVISKDQYLMSHCGDPSNLTDACIVNHRQIPALVPMTI